LLCNTHNGNDAPQNSESLKKVGYYIDLRSTERTYSEQLSQYTAIYTCYYTELLSAYRSLCYFNCGSCGVKALFVTRKYCILRLGWN